MNSFTKRSVTVFSILLASVFHTKAQSTSSAYEIGINAGTLIYQGDLTPKFYGYTKALKPALGLTINKSLNPYFSLRAALTFGKISADESKYENPVWRKFRALKFNSSVTELSSTIVFHTLSNKVDEYSSRLSPYFFAGAGLTVLNVHRDYSSFNAEYFEEKNDADTRLESDTLNSPPKFIPILPIGAGITYVLSSRLAINLEGNYRLTRSDGIDGFRYSGIEKRKDSYYGISAGIVYRLGSNGYKCPTVR